MSDPVIAYFDGVRTMQETDKAWMAGFVDGEGCLTIVRQVRKGRPSPTYRASITISNTCRDALTPFVDVYGGTIYDLHERRKDKRNLAWANAYDWYCPVSSSGRFLTDILPYLRLKRRQAEIILEFIRTKDGFSRKFWPGQGGGSAPLSEEEIGHRERLRQSVQLLNSKGQRAREALANA